jgi:spermidine synthase
MGQQSATTAGGCTAARWYPLPLLYLLFFVSGSSALVHQTAWQRILGLFSGSDSVSTTIVVGAFLLGLGLGSLLASGFADRFSDRGAVRAFALCEAGIGAFGATSKFLFYDLIFEHLGAVAASRPLVFLVVFLALLPPTLLMGLSLPLLAKPMVQDIETASARIGWLYGVNTLGAAVGAFTGGCFVIGTVGYEVTIYFAAMLNLLVGGGALLIAPSFCAEKNSYGEQTRSLGLEPRPTPVRLWHWCFLVFVSGFIIISLEIIWFRVIGTMLQSTAYSFSLVLGWLLIGDATGIIAGAFAVGRAPNPERFFLWLQGAVTLYSTIALWLIAWAHRWPAVADRFIAYDYNLRPHPTVFMLPRRFRTRPRACAWRRDGREPRQN